jgi:hypothetical protein
MKSKEEIEKRLLELKKEYTNRFFSVGNEPETICVGEQAKLLEWVLDIPYITIQENQNKDDE